MIFSFSEFCCGKAIVAFTKPQQRKKEESERLRGERDQIKLIALRRLRGERDQIKLIALRFERWQVVGLRKARRRQDVP